MRAKLRSSGTALWAEQAFLAVGNLLISQGQKGHFTTGKQCRRVKTCSFIFGVVEGGWWNRKKCSIKCELHFRCSFGVFYRFADKREEKGVQLFRSPVVSFYLLWWTPAFP